MGEAGESSPAAAAPERAARALDRLERAVAELEQAVGAHGRRPADDDERSSDMRAEAEALRSLQHLLSDRLDAAIARLKTGVGD